MHADGLAHSHGKTWAAQCLAGKTRSRSEDLKGDAF